MPTGIKGEVLDRLMDRCKKDKADYISFFESDIEPVLKERLQVYDADSGYYGSKFPEIWAKSQLKQQDVADAFSWMLPYLDGIFLGGTDSLSLTGEGGEDVELAEALMELCNMQVQKQNDGFRLMHTTHLDALQSNFAIWKIWWERKKAVASEEGLTFNLDIPEDAVQLQSLMAQADEMTEIADQQVIGEGIVGVTVRRYRWEKNQPVIRAVPAQELLWDKRAKTVDDMNPIHRTRVTIDFLRRKAKEKGEDGKPLFDPKKVEDAIAKTGEDIQSDLGRTYNTWDDGSEEYDPEDPRSRLTLYEHYTQEDINGDGLLENVIVTEVADIPLRVEENKMPLPHPFIVFSVVLEPHRLFAKRGLVDALGELQHLNVAVINQVIIAVGLSNRVKRLWNSEAVEIDDVESDLENIECKGPVGDAVKDLPPVPIHSLTTLLIEHIQQAKQDRSGVTRVLQGDVAGQQNKTASGTRDILNTANKVIQEIGMVLAETGYKRAFRYLVDLNLMYMDPETMTRLTGKAVDLSQIDRTFDIEVATGMSMTTPEGQAQVLMQAQDLINRTAGAFMPPDKTAALLRKIVSHMGIRDVDTVIPTDEEIPLVMAWKQFMQMQMAMSQGGQNDGGTIPGQGQQAGEVAGEGETLSGGAGGAGVPGILGALVS